jgi:rhodanese-related sulfurtransferase
LTSSLTVEDLRKQPAGFQLVDVRSPSEFASGHIPGAVNIPMDQIESRMDDLRLDLPIVLICQMGKRARMTANLLGPCGRELSILEGGTSAWMQAGLAMVKNVKTRWSLERQVRLAAGLLVVSATALAFTVSPLWLGLAAFVGLGLTFAGFTDICPMAELLQKLPWNRGSHCKVSSPPAEFSRSNQ